MKWLSDFTHGSVRAPLEEKGAVKITQIQDLQMKLFIFPCGYGFMWYTSHIGFEFMCATWVVIWRHIKNYKLK